MSDASYIGRIGWRLIILPMLQDNSALNENTVSIRNLIVNIIPSDLITPFNTNNILQLI